MSTVKVGDVWRKMGPCDWVKVVRVQFPGVDGYDGGLPGCSIRLRTWRGTWQRKTWFYPAKSAEDFERQMRESFRFMMPKAAKEPKK